MSITPGKWKVTEIAFGGAKFDHQIGICSVDGKLIATASTIHVGAINAEANARAIAEVPTMIETLKAWISAEDMPCMKGEEMVAYNEQYHRALRSAKDILKRIEG